MMHIQRICLALAVAMVFGCGTQKAHTQSTNPSRQPLYLSDLTPRPLDPPTEFGDNPNERALLEQRSVPTKQRSRYQVLADTREILLRAEQLRSYTTHPDGSPLVPLDRMSAQQIEKLAKNVKATMQMQ